MIIAIDGTASSGKSSCAKQLAKIIGFVHLNTGSIYRAIAYHAYKNNLNEKDIEKIISLVKKTNLEVKIENGESIMYLNNVRLEKELRTPEVSELVSKIAPYEELRRCARALQRKVAKQYNNVIVEGRDIGSKVFPNAEIKLYITASLEVRAQRRQLEYEKLGTIKNLKDVIVELEKRDNEDTTRANAPLVICKDAIVFDTSLYDYDTMIAELVKLVNNLISKINKLKLHT